MTKDTITYNDAILCIGEPIATAPVANTILNINGGVDINGDLNIGQGCSYRVGGSAITGSKWTTSGTTINYGLGNVGIGNTNPQGRLHIGTDALNQGFGEILIGANNGSGSRTTKMGWDSEFYYNLCGDYTGGGQNSWASKQIRCYWTAPTNSLYIDGDGRAYTPNGITAGNVVSPSYILSNDAVYARSSYDTKIRSASDGMFLEMGDIGNNNYLRIGAYNGGTNIDSGASRVIYFRSAGYSWQFNQNTSVNSAGSAYWNTYSDQRIKENIKKSNLKICYDNVKNINLYRFNYKKELGKGTQIDKTQLGFVAQQVNQHFPKSVHRNKQRLEDKREVPDLATIDINQVNYTLFGAVKQLMKVVEKQSKRIKKLEEMLGIVDDDIVEDDADEPYERIVCDEVDIDDIEPSEPVGV
jgi:hypothetical protein